MARRLGIYIHIPFCASKCSYCDFYSLAGCEHLMPEYHKALLAHLDESAKSIKNYEVDSIYFGGGTPSFYGADRIVEIFNALKLNGNVRLDAEVTIEVNPDSISLNALKLLREEGVNRLSIGVQASDNNLLKLIGRRHNFQQAQTAVANARKAGFDNVSLDLIYGLPEQTMTRWQANLDTALALAPEHLSCYGLKVEEGTPLSARRERFTLPDDDTQADMYLSAVGLLARQGYEQYEISNFCRPGRASRHNSRYWTLAEYLGFGPGAHSDFGGERFALARDLDAYLAGHTVYSERSAPSARERETERVMLALRTTRGVAADTLPEAARRILRNCEAHGLAHLSGGFYALTPRGFLVSNAILVDLLETMEL